MPTTTVKHPTSRVLLVCGCIRKVLLFLQTHTPLKLDGFKKKFLMLQSLRIAQKLARTLQNTLNCTLTGHLGTFFREKSHYFLPKLEIKPPRRSSTTPSWSRPSPFWHWTEMGALVAWISSLCKIATWERTFSHHQTTIVPVQGGSRLHRWVRARQPEITSRSPQDHYFHRFFFTINPPTAVGNPRHYTAMCLPSKWWSLTKLRSSQQTDPVWFLHWRDQHSSAITCVLFQQFTNFFFSLVSQPKGIKIVLVCRIPFSRDLSLFHCFSTSRESNIYIIIPWFCDYYISLLRNPQGVVFWRIFC